MPSFNWWQSLALLSTILLTSTALTLDTQTGSPLLSSFEDEINDIALDSGDGTSGGNGQKQILGPSIGKDPEGVISQGNDCSSSGLQSPRKKRSERENECRAEQSPEESIGQQNTESDRANNVESYTEYFYNLRAKQDKGLCGEERPFPVCSTEQIKIVEGGPFPGYETLDWCTIRT